MHLAALDVWHSRPVAPTRRVAIGASHLPVRRPPDFGGLLLAGIVGAFHGELDPELRADLSSLIDDLAWGRRIPQPRLRHRLQVDRIGLMRSTHELIGEGQRLSFRFAQDAPPAPQVLAAVYAAGRLPPHIRHTVMTTVRSGLRWPGGDHADLVAYLSGRPWGAPVPADPVGWALSVFEWQERTRSARQIQKRFRELLRLAHPDHGGDLSDAGDRIAELTAARRILLS